ncbi:MAG TPA: ectonucleotide pyrophosphatase/phosphodiesterase [Tepidisphaeraceae bacterium]|jgi:arylsulfatase A-like enzyme|nr:ectonucleotide pyrophosphatase/phosphodiesterase [Tepidisphaeraceae bacterium]
MTQMTQIGADRMQKLVFLLGMIAVAHGCGRPTEQAKPTVKHVIIVSVDGLRPDMMLRTNTPVMRSLMRAGCYTMWARTTEVSITLPSHVSMLTGVVPERHAIWWNIELDKEYMRYPSVPTIFELAKARGLTTALAVGKGKLEALGKPGSLDWAYWPDGYAQAIQVAHEARNIIEQHRPQLLFIHFPDVDAAGHGSGWGSRQQAMAVERADQSLGVVLAALRHAGIRESTAIILSSDHGGAGYSHGVDDARSRNIPWIISGPGIRKNIDLTTKDTLVVNTEDTFATACYLLNIPMDEEIDGKAVLQVLEDIRPDEEMLLGTSPATTQGYVPYRGE